MSYRIPVVCLLSNDCKEGGNREIQVAVVAKENGIGLQVWEV
jgi:hypothetical protein